jgi:rRNA-processing protein FCF1
LTVVILDTNALLLPFTEGTRIEEGLEAIFDEVEMVVPACVKFELEQISAGKTNAARHAKAALKLSARYRQEPTKYTGDDGILELARRLKATVLTNDRILQAEATKSGLQVVVARGHGRLAVMKSGS